jgi:serine/threonine-protein kinase
MLVGRKPFHCDDTDKLLQQIVHKAPPPPVEIDPDVPLALSQIVMKAMSKRPEKRYETAEKMALDIKRYLVRERRARQRMKIPVATLEQRDPDRGFPPRETLFLGTAIAGAIVAAIVTLLR